MDNRDLFRPSPQSRLFSLERFGIMNPKPSELTIQSQSKLTWILTRNDEHAMIVFIDGACLGNGQPDAPLPELPIQVQEHLIDHGYIKTNHLKTTRYNL